MVSVNTDEENFFHIANYKKDWLFPYEEKNYWQISPFGDGNCGLYAFACGLIDSIITEKLTIKDKTFAEFISIVREFLNLKSENTSRFNRKLALEFDKFKQLLYRPNLTFVQFKFFIKFQLQTPESLAAINLILSEGLRTIGVKLYENFKKEIGVQEVFLEDRQLLKSRVPVGAETLDFLANYFGICIKLISKITENIPKKEAPVERHYFHQNSLEDNKATPLFNLLREKDHWYYLIPEANEDGLTRIFPSEKTEIESEKNQSKGIQRGISRELLCLNENAIHKIETDYTNKQTVIAETKVATFFERFAKKLKEIFNYLNQIFGTTPNQTDEFNHAVIQARTAAKDSTQIINSWREKWRVSPQLDAQLNKLNLHKLEEALLRAPLITDKSDDAALATILQNAEIADFLSRTHITLKTCTPSLSTNNCSADIRDHSQSVTAHDLRNVALCISV